MYPPSPFAVPIGSFNQPVALPTTDPNQGPLFYIGINCEWMPYVAGALSQLLLQTTWDTSDVDALQLVQNRAQLLISLFNCSTAPNAEQLCGLLGSGGEDCMGCCLRFQDGVLQQLECGVWTAVPGQGIGGVFPPTQPGAGTEVPGAGECKTYHASVPSGKQWLLPTLVNSGDVLTPSNPQGATTDIGGPGRWNCPDGGYFQLGSNQGNQITDPDTPAPDLFYGSMIWAIDGVYYNALEPLTIPGGIVNAPAVLMINYDDGGAYYGEDTLDVEFCNNTSGTFRHVFDFVSTPGTFQPYSDSLFTTPIGVWSPGVGWDQTLQVEAGVGYRVAAAGRDFTSRTLTSIQMKYDLSEGHNDSGGAPGIQFFVDGSLVFSVPWNAEVGGTDQEVRWDGTASAASVLQFFLGVGNQTGGADPGGTGTVTQLIVEGIGSDPFI